VIDISNPSAPVLKAAMPNGFIETGLPPALGLGEEPQEKGIGHTASCIQDCRFAYLAGTSRGIQIVDLRDPSNPKKAGQFKPAITGLATHDVQVDSDGYAWIVGGDGSAA
jgi:LVIVD repeat